MEKVDNVEKALVNPSIQGWIVQSLIGAHYKENGPASTRELIYKHILSRDVDVEAHVDLYVKTNVPRRLLWDLAKRLGQQQPVARFFHLIEGC